MPSLRILVLSHYFPPEVNAAANRIHETARVWVAAGHQVTVVTCTPNHPMGIVYPGYRNRFWQRETVAGIEVIRLWTFVAANRGVLRRTLNYLSYMVSVVLAAPSFPNPDIVISTSPQFFCGLAGYPVSRNRRIPWILEIRDLWPESIIAVGAMRPGILTRALHRIERFAYRSAAHLVSVSDAFIPHFERCGISRSKISVITNGVDPAFFDGSHDAASFRKRHGLEGKFVAAYVGTHGMAHGLETVLQAADRLRMRRDIVFLLIGDGSERSHLVKQCLSMALPNVVMLPQVARHEIPTVWAASDAALVLLRENPTFELVIPSKMLEALGTGRPVLLGVRGKARQIIEDGNCGLVFAPENAAGLAEVTTTLADDRALARRLGENGVRLAATTYNRELLAHRYLQLLVRLVQTAGPDVRADDKERRPAAR